MELKVRAVAGTLESSDVYIIVEPSNERIIEIKSSVLDQYGDDIKNVVNETLKEMNVQNVKIIIEDKGALDVVIKSRLETAIMRSRKSTEFNFK